MVLLSILVYAADAATRSDRLATFSRLLIRLRGRASSDDRLLNASIRVTVYLIPESQFREVNGRETRQ